MARWKEGDRVRIVTRPATKEDRISYRYFPHMAGMVGTVAHVFNADEIVMTVDPEALNKVARDVQAVAVDRMRTKFVSKVGEEQQAKLTPEELKFDANYNLLVRSGDLEKV